MREGESDIRLDRVAEMKSVFESAIGRNLNEAAKHLLEDQ